MLVNHTIIKRRFTLTVELVFILCSLCYDAVPAAVISISLNAKSIVLLTCRFDNLWEKYRIHDESFA